MIIGLNLGCCFNKIPSSTTETWTNLDNNPLVNPDKLVDLEKGNLPFEDSSFDTIVADSILEHIINVVPLMEECWRVLKPTGIMRISVPEFPKPSSVLDPGHVRFFAQETFSWYMVPADGVDVHGRLERFWRCTVPVVDGDMIFIDMFPNKPGITMFPYVEVKSPSGKQFPLFPLGDNNG